MHNLTTKNCINYSINDITHNRRHINIKISIIDNENIIMILCDAILFASRPFAHLITLFPTFKNEIKDENCMFIFSCSAFFDFETLRRFECRINSASFGRCVRWSYSLGLMKLLQLSAVRWIMLIRK